MIRRMSVGALRRTAEKPGYVVVVMRHYPRGLARETRDEYLADLAPESELFREFKERDRDSGDHDGAFDAVSYEKRFWLTSTGRSDLQRLASLSTTSDVTLVCQCDLEQKCHADLLMIMAKRMFGATADVDERRYPIFVARVEAWAAPI